MSLPTAFAAHLARDKRRSPHTVRAYQAGAERLLDFLQAHWGTSVDQPALARLTAAGAKVVSAPHRIHVHDDGREEWMAFIEDLDGGPLGLMATVGA